VRSAGLPDRPRSPVHRSRLPYPQMLCPAVPYVDLPLPYGVQLSVEGRIEPILPAAAAAEGVVPVRLTFSPAGPITFT